MSSAIIFPHAEEYNNNFAYSVVRKGHNCLLWAAGVKEPLSVCSRLSELNYKIGDVGSAFLQKIGELYTEGLIPYNSLNLVKVESEDSLPESSTHIFKVFGFRTAQVWNQDFGFYMDVPGDFHVIRGEKEPDGSISWEHKFGWDENPRRLTEEDVEALEADYGENYVLYAFIPHWGKEPR